MKRNLAFAGLLSLAIVGAYERPSDACGVKLTIKTNAPKKPTTHSSNSGSVLFVGSHSGNLQRNVKDDGNDTENEPTASSAKKKSYAVVVTDAEHADEARSQFGSDRVYVATGDDAQDQQAIAARTGRRPTGTSRTGTLVATSGSSRKIVAAGPDRGDNKQLVDAKAGGDVQADVTPPKPAPTPIKATPVVAKVEPPPAPTPPPQPEPEPTPAPPPQPEHVASVEPAHTESRPAAAPVKPKAFRASEVYFGLGASKVSGGLASQLNRTAKALSASDVNVTIEGYADPTGNHDDNMALSQARAEAVRDYLSSQGVDGSRMEVKAFGDTKLKYGAHDGRNRRVAIMPVSQ